MFNSPTDDGQSRLRVLLFYSECSSFIYLLCIFFLFDRIFSYAGPVLSLLLIMCLLVLMNALPALVRRHVIMRYRQQQAQRAAAFLERPENARVRTLVLVSMWWWGGQKVQRLVSDRVFFVFFSTLAL